MPAWPIAFAARLPPGSSWYRTVGWTLRILGAVALMLVAVAAVLFITAATTAQNVDGWEDLITAITIGLGILALVGALVLSLPVHFAYRRWVARDRRGARSVAGVGIGYAVLGVLLTLPYALRVSDTPLDLYVMVAGIGLLLAGGVLVLGARRA